MSTRQLRRARKRAPKKKKRRGTAVFTASMLAILLAGGAAAAFFPTLFRTEGPPRGAAVGEHWHAVYAIELCGKRLEPYPFVEDDVHTHGDGQIHLHPNTQAFAGENANLGAFFRTVESRIGVNADGNRFFVLPDGARYTASEACEKGGEPRELEVFVNGEAVDGDPSAYLPQEGDEILIRFGPQATEMMENPLPPDHLGGPPSSDGS